MYVHDQVREIVICSDERIEIKGIKYALRAI